ncbi:succinylglutamate desuccinylase/aspartoacylase family protein [Shewanella sp. KX20019]|uniref:M14 family metallopeptidase n=1 Tax=Shewanella sp. KX20019 TaxID=2803864 RepID=UPI001926EA90|nr:M14-type cytosolic carboxypeptidase [Shewanella sp. KX20019]QQX80061.1 succinylglutamate desuccinylase/aspartoacylase family protein [Shewanella sp. KX20019]
MLYKISFIILSFVVIACSSVQPITRCDGPDLKVSSNFENARVNDCKIVDGKIKLSITPENEPINDSPWYAFKITSTTEKEVEVSISYQGGHQRYTPKASQNRINWQPLKYRVRNNVLHFKVAVSPTPTFIAGQELITNKDYDIWMKSLAKQPNVRHYTLGQSTQLRDIGALEVTGGGDEWIVVLGRQHPPEVTGALALFPFVNNLIADSQLSARFMQRFNILIVPDLNPDGVALGNWRHNANGVDLNRDWKAFKQVESRLVRDKLKGITQSGGKIVFAVDFHSTKKDIFYTMPSDYGLNPPLLVESWLAELRETVSPFVIREQPGHNSDKGIFKQFIADEYGVHGITYEMGDNTDRAVIKKLAVVASDGLMQKMLATTPSEFKGKSLK